MNALLYGIGLQLKLDIRSKNLLITCYIVPLLFFFLMGGIFTSINPEMKNTLIQSMTVMGVSMGAFLGLSSSIAETYGSDVKKAYISNGVPLYLGLVSMFISALIHLMIMCMIIYFVAPFAFEATIPTNFPLYCLSLAIFIAVSLSFGCILGLIVKEQAKLTMISQLIFLPSIMLSGIMFPINLLPQVLEFIGKFFPAAWGYKLMLNQGFQLGTLLPLLLIFTFAIFLNVFLLKKQHVA